MFENGVKRGLRFARGRPWHELWTMTCTVCVHTLKIHLRFISSFLLFLLFDIFHIHMSFKIRYTCSSRSVCTTHGHMYWQAFPLPSKDASAALDEFISCIAGTCYLFSFSFCNWPAGNLKSASPFAFRHCQFRQHF